MGGLIDGDDGLPAEEVGHWVSAKHDLLRKYIDVSRAVRRRWIGRGRAGATYIDLFCGTGRSRIRKNKQWVDGSCVAAWRESVRGGAPFSSIYLADVDDERRGYAVERLRRLGAPVISIPGNAVTAAKDIAERLHPEGLHCAFLDPYNLGALDFGVLRVLASMKRIDILVHVSKMDLQRNLGFNISGQHKAFDIFAPAWRENINLNQSSVAIRVAVFEYWRNLMAAEGLGHAPEMRLITGSKNQPLYWLLLAAKHDLAKKFWQEVARIREQPTLL